jgi:hypothetical protein
MGQKMGDREATFAATKRDVSHTFEGLLDGQEVATESARQMKKVS